MTSSRHGHGVDGGYGVTRTAGQAVLCAKESWAFKVFRGISGAPPTPKTLVAHSLTPGLTTKQCARILSKVPSVAGLGSRRCRRWPWLLSERGWPCARVCVWTAPLGAAGPHGDPALRDPTAAVLRCALRVPEFRPGPPRFQALSPDLSRQRPEKAVGLGTGSSDL